MNLFFVRKMLSLFMCGLLPLAAMLTIMIAGYDFILGFAAYVIVLVLMVILSNFFIINHPFLKMLEGQGMLVFTFDSFGKIESFNVKIDLNEIMSKDKKRPLKDVWDRHLAFTMSPPKDVSVKVTKNALENTETENYLHMSLPLKNLQDHIFNFESRIVLVYNRPLRCFMDKKTMAENESSIFAKHLIMLLKRRTEEQNEYLKSFHRTVIENSTKPKMQWWENKWVQYVALLVGIGIVLAISWPMLSQFLGGVVQGIPQATGQIVSARQ